MKRTVIAVASIAVIGLSGAELLHQGFENPDFFAARNSNNYTIAPAGTDGKWCNMTEKLVSDEQAAEGKYSFKMTKQTGKSQHIELALPEFDGPGELEIWFYREPENNFSFALLGNKLADGHIAGLGIWDKSRQYAYYDTAAKKWQRTGLKSPAETWQRVVIRFNADKSKAEVLVGDMDKLEKLDLSENHLEHCSALKHLENLVYFKASHCQLRSIDFLKNSKKLVELNLYTNLIERIDTLRSCERMTVLNVGNNAIKDITCLEEMKQVLAQAERG